MSKWSSEKRTERLCIMSVFHMTTANPGEGGDSQPGSLSYAQGLSEVTKKGKSVQLQPH